MKTWNKIFALLCLVMTVVSCKDNYSDIFAEGEFRVSNDKLLFKQTAKSLTIQVGGAYEWDVDVSKTAEWCSVKPVYRFQEKDYAIIDVLANEGITARNTTFDLVSDFDRKTITVSQLGSEISILFNKDDILYRGKNRTVIDLLILANVDFTMSSDAEWLKIENSYVDEETPVRLSVAENTTGEGRTGTITFKQKDGDYSTTLQVVQSNQDGEYEQGDISNLKANHKLEVVSAIASSTEAKMGIELSYDGDKVTYYQASQWNAIDEPVVLEYHFTGEESLDYVIYTPYTRDTKKLFGKTEIWVKCAGKDYEKVKDHTFAGQQTQVVMFDEKIMNPESVKFVVKSGSDKDDKEHLVVACAEMEFYATTMHYPDIFTNQSYSALLSDVTLEQIFEMKDEFFRTIAEHLYYGTYPELRTQNYKAYQNPSSINYVTESLGVLDNVTGISVTKGDTIVVMTDQLRAESVFLTLLQPGQNEFRQRDVLLMEGINKLVMEESGLLYIKNFNVGSEPVFVHIAGGRTNGFYDTQIHTEADGIGSLQTAEGKYFDLLGRYVHLIFPTEILKEYSSQLKTLVDKYDRIVELQRHFIGMPDDINNRVCVMSVADLNAEETENVVLLNETLIALYADPEKLTGDVLWDVSSNIARKLLPYGLSWNPAFRELNVQYVLSEMEGNDYLLNNGFYANALDRFVVKSENIENKTKLTDTDRIVPLWQIYLYMKEIKGDKDFFARLFSSLVGKMSRQQTFVAELNKVSGIDFKSFLQTWSFSAYASAPAQTEKVSPVLEYLCESNIETFRNSGIASAMGCSYVEKTITEAGVVRRVYEMTVEGAENIVGCEVVSMGNLVLKSGTVFEIDEYTYSTKVTAIGLNGERIDLKCYRK